MAKGERYPQTCIAAMVVIRLFLGGFFIYSACAKLITPHQVDAVMARTETMLHHADDTDADDAATTSPAKTPKAFEQFADELRRATRNEHAPFVKDNVWPWYGTFLRNTVSQSAASFGWLIIIGEMAVGLFFLLGFLTRLTAGLALLMTITVLLTTMHLSFVYLTSSLSFIVMEIAMLVAGAGKTFGLDALLGKGRK